MGMYALMSPGGSPGVTTTALALTYAWEGRALLAECDPQGGSVLRGFLAGSMEDHQCGLLELALAAAHNADPAIVWQHVIALDHDIRKWLLLPGLRDPRHLVQLDGAWDTIAEILKASQDAADVVLDVGQIGRSDTPMNLIAASDVAVMLVRPTLRHVAQARPRLDALGHQVGADVTVGLCVVGDGPYTLKEVSRALFDLPVLAWIPHDPKSAAVLSDGKPAKRSFHRSALMRGTVPLGYAIRHRHTQQAVAR
jgi:MinD-like ATPase involved in chromosome partitioning or flagellar assembly